MIKVLESFLIPIYAINGEELFSLNANSVKDCVEKSIAAGMSLRGANFEYDDLSGVNFSNMDLRFANFNDANLTGCNFTAANLEDARFINTNLTNCIFDHTSMSGVYLRMAVMDPAHYLKYNLKLVKFDKDTILKAILFAYKKDSTDRQYILRLISAAKKLYDWPELKAIDKSIKGG